MFSETFKFIFECIFFPICGAFTVFAGIITFKEFKEILNDESMYLDDEDEIQDTTTETINCEEPVNSGSTV